MAVKQGYFAKIIWTDNSEPVQSYVINAYNWSLTYEAGEGETTAFPTETPLVPHPKSFIPLVTEWSGSCQLRLDADTAAPNFDLTLCTIKLYAHFSDVAPLAEFGYAGDCFCKAQNPTLDVNGVPESTVNFRGSGALTVGDISAVS